jgi:hypothetical protein
VYYPGPLLTATAFKDENNIPELSSTSSIKSVMIEECEFFTLVSFELISFPSLHKAMEQLIVDVSIHKIMSRYQYAFDC